MSKSLTPRERILRQHGLKETHPPPRKKRKLVVRRESSIRKTAMMRYLEEKYAIVIEDILVSGSLSTIADRLGYEVGLSTLSKWRKEFNLRYTISNLPDCVGCQHSNPTCQAGICYVLLHVGSGIKTAELMEAKRKEVLGK